MRHLALSLAVTCLAATAAQAGDYLPLNASSANRAVLVEKASLTGGGDQRNVTLVVVFAAPQTAPGVAAPYYAMEMQQQVDCPNGRYRTLEHRSYGETGAVVTQGAGAPGEWQPAQPGTDGAEALGLACGQLPLPPASVSGDLQGGLAAYRRMIAGSQTAETAYYLDHPAEMPYAGPALAEMQADFPDLWTSVREAMRNAMQSGRSPVAAQQAVGALETRFVAQHMSDLANAPDNALIAYVASLAALLDHERQVDVARCGTLQGAPAPPLTLDDAGFTAALTAAAFKAIRAGIDHPVTRPDQPQEADVRDLLAAMSAAGEPQDLIRDTFNPAALASRGPADQCDAAIDLEEAMASLPAPEGARLVATLVAAAARRQAHPAATP